MSFFLKVNYELKVCKDIFVLKTCFPFLRFGWYFPASSWWKARMKRGSDKHGGNNKRCCKYFEAKHFSLKMQ